MGMRQRLGVAACLLGDPELLILDEPMNGLDPAGMAEFRALLRGFTDEGRTVVLSSHLLDEVERTCDMVAVVDRGRVIAQGPIDEVVGGGGLSVSIGCDDPMRARQLLLAHGLAADAILEGGRLTAELDPRLRPFSRDAAGAMNRVLVEQGISVHSISVARDSLEKRFLDITTKLGDPA
jgi:ABC-2 type transport system ATP-binding protein